MERNVIYFSTKEAANDAASLIREYPELAITEETETNIIVEGKVTISVTYNDFPIFERPTVKIVIPINSDKFPIIYDTGGVIEKDYEHRYTSGELCLSTEFDMRVHFADEFKLIIWFNDYVIPYYYSYRYFKRFGCFPFDDREHGFNGILQSYIDFFKTDDVSKIGDIIHKILTTEVYRGHHDCFCGSGKRMRSCHGDQIIMFYKYPQLISQLQLDLLILKKEMWTLNDCRRNSKPTE